MMRQQKAQNLHLNENTKSLKMKMNDKDIYILILTYVIF